MNFWRITKYNPRFRAQDGRYLKDEWTSCSDIGRTFDGSELTPEAYTAVESAYLRSAMSFVAESMVPDLQVVSVENYVDSPPPVTDGQLIHGGLLEDVCRLNLRESMWCKLERRDSFFIHFGYEYYMYIGSQSPCIQSIRIATDAGLFVEEMKSPYLTW